MRLNKKVMLSIVALPFCAALIGCAPTTEQPESMVVQPATRLGPVVKAPVYKNGDWWKVKVERKGRAGQSCRFDYSDYLLEIQKGKPMLYGINGTNKEEFDCPRVEDEILGKITERLKFPLRVGKRWAHLYKKELGSGYHRAGRRRITVEYEVLGWESVQTPKGEFEAFKLSSRAAWRTRREYPEQRETYYYSPKIKAIILRKSTKRGLGGHERDTTNTVVDFNVSN